MITFDFDYYRPTTIEEAVNTFALLKGEGKEPIYYSGGTEIISLAKLDDVSFSAVIDIKEIPECNIIEFQENKLIIGAAVTLTKISSTGFFPLLGDVCKGLADHTARDMITVGGNICGKIPYRESILPFLVSDSLAVIGGYNGIRTVPINKIFNKHISLQEGEFLVQLITDKSYISLPYYTRKRTKFGIMDYPLVTVVSLIKENNIRIGISGVFAYPFRSSELEAAINDKNVPSNTRINNALSNLADLVLNDIRGSDEYRIYVLKNMLADVIMTLGGE